MQLKNVSKLTTLCALASASFAISQPVFAHEDISNEPERADKFYNLTREYRHPHHELYRYPHHHYHLVYGTNTSIHFIANPRLDTTFDSGAFGGTYLSGANIPLKGVDTAAHSRGNFNMSAQGSEFGFKTKTHHTHLGLIDTHVEFNFIQNTGNTDTRQSDNYSPTLSFAYFDANHWRVGQDTTNFFDLDSIGYTVDYGTAMGGFLRQPQIRYSRHVPHHHHWSWSAALERPATDYTKQDGTFTRTYEDSGLPDATFNVRWQRHNAHATVRGLVRGLRVHDQSGTNDFKNTDTAFGLGVSGRYFFVDGSSIFGQFNMGDGIGRYIIDANGQSAFFNDSTGVFQSQRALFSVLGTEVIWPTHSHKVRSNFIWTHMHVDASSYTPVGTQVTTGVDKFFSNIIFEPVKGLDLGLEYAYARRETLANAAQGHINRATAAAVYHF